MKILYLHQYFNTPVMPGSTRSYEMARRFAKAGHEVHMVTSDRTGQNKAGWKVETVDGFTVHWNCVRYSNYMGFGKRILAFIRFAVQAARKAAFLGGDIVFATSTPLTIALPGVYVAKRLSIPMVFEVRDLWPELPIAMGMLRNPLLKFAAHWLENFAYRHTSAVVALSPGMAAGVAQKGYDTKKIHVVPNCCDIDLFNVPASAGTEFLEKYPYLKGGSLIVYAGTIGRMNHVESLVHIAAHMKSIDPNTKFLVAGEGKQRDSVYREAKKLGVLEKNFWLIPPIPKKEVPALLSAATVATSFFFDCESMWNNSANKFFDALAAGRPLMINYQGWQADLLRKTKAGIVVPPKSPQKSAVMLHEFVQDNKRIVQAQRASRNLAIAEFDRDLLADKLLQVLTSTRL